MPALNDRVVEREWRDSHERTPTHCHGTTPAGETRAAAMACAEGPHGGPAADPGPSPLGLEPRRGTPGSDRAVGATGVGSRDHAGAGPAPAGQPAPAGSWALATGDTARALWPTAAEL